MSEDHKWSRIEDLPENWKTLSDGGLRSLLQMWQQRRQELDKEGAAKRFNERLNREWVIETGVIEGVYSLDRGITEVLLERGIDARYIPTSATDRDPEFVAQVIQDHEAVLDGLFDFVKGNRALTVGYVKELHAALLRQQKTTTMKDQFGDLIEVSVEHGAYKRLPNNPRRPDGTTFEYCPPVLPSRTCRVGDGPAHGTSRSSYRAGGVARGRIHLAASQIRTDPPFH